MAKQKKRRFGSVEEIFKEYIPDYIPPALREAHEGHIPQEKTFDTKFTAELLRQFERNIKP